jgi:hypothetical protein
VWFVSGVAIEVADVKSNFAKRGLKPMAGIVETV